MDNDKTKGRPNARQGASASSSGAASAATSTASGGQQHGQQPPASHPAGTSSRSSHAPKATAKTSTGPFEWPTSSEHYQLVNRVGQGAFASVWMARIVTVSNDDDAAVEREEEVQECAIKIMDLEHVNINISGELRLSHDLEELERPAMPETMYS